MEPWACAVLFTFLASLWYLFSSLRAAKKVSLPPGPYGLPLLGHLHLLSDLPHQDLQKLAKKYGPIMSIRLGLIPTIIVTSPEYAELFLKTHDLVFAGRPKLQAAGEMFYGQKNLSFVKYGTYWRNMRRLCTIELLSSSRIELFKPMRCEEVSSFVMSLKNESEAGCKVDITAKIKALLEGMTYRMVIGGKDDTNIISAIQEGLRMVGLFNVTDYIPCLGSFDIQGIGRRMKALSKVLDGFLEKVINEHEHDAEKLAQPRDFVDVMLSLMESNNTRELQLTRDHIKSILLEMLSGSMETSSTSIEWVVAELLKNPRVMKLVQEELENVVGLDRMVEETDLIKFDYLQMVIKESMRVHPVAPLLVPHESIEDVTVNGYFIRKKSRVLINTWAMGRDCNVWSDNAGEFYPERFIGTNIDIRGHDFQLLPFGAGRRMCPGIQLGITVVQLVLAQLLHCFNLELPEGMPPDDLDMSEKFGLSLPRANHILAIPSYRLRDSL